MPEPTEEQLKAMTPEQLKEMQKQQCIFCQIVSGKVASRKIYEDDVCIAVLDINPANPGHALIIPKEHYSIMPLMPDKVISHLFLTAKKISTAVLRGLKADGTNIFIANGAAAGQKAPHFMIHLIPRRENDGITALTVPQNVMEKEDADKLRSAISRSIRARLGGREEPVSVDKPKPATVDKITKEPAKFDLDSISKMFK
jgi:histidine triad (HIT) family protein